MRWHYVIAAVDRAPPASGEIDAPTRGTAQARADALAVEHGRAHGCVTYACRVHRDGWSLWDPDSEPAAAAWREALLHGTAALVARMRIADRTADLPLVGPPPGWEDRLVERWRREWRR